MLGLILVFQTISNLSNYWTTLSTGDFSEIPEDLIVMHKCCSLLREHSNILWTQFEAWGKAVKQKFLWKSIFCDTTLWGLHCHIIREDQQCSWLTLLKRVNRQVLPDFFLFILVTFWFQKVKIILLVSLKMSH